MLKRMIPYTLVFLVIFVIAFSIYTSLNSYIPHTNSPINIIPTTIIQDTIPNSQQSDNNLSMSPPQSPIPSALPSGNNNNSPNQEIDVIYNRYGEPVLRLLNNGRLVDFDGKSFGFIDGKNLYNYNGEHIGWFENGIMRDRDGATIGFSENPTDIPRPLLPLKQFKPPLSPIQPEPLRPLEQFAPLEPFKKFNWSEN